MYKPYESEITHVKSSRPPRMFHWDAVDTSPDLRGQNVLKTFEMMAIRHNRRTTRTELERVFCRWTYFHLRSKIFFPALLGESDRPVLWTHHCWRFVFTAGATYRRECHQHNRNVLIDFTGVNCAGMSYICHHLYDASWVMSRNRESISYGHRPDFRNFLRPSRKIFLSFSQVRR